MAFTKITEADLTGKGVVGLPDTPGLSTTEMQEKFDEIANDVLVPKHNVLIDELEDSTGADSIGAKDIEGNDSTVQNEFDNRYAKSEVNVLLDNKVDKEDGKGLSTFDFSTAYKDKLNGIEDNANNYVLPKGTQSEIGGVMGDGSTFTIDENGVGHAIGGGGGGTADYTALINKPKLNGSTIIGDKQSEEYGILRPYLVVTSEAGSVIKIKKGTTEIVATQKTSTTWEVCPTSYGTWTVTSELSGADIASDTITIDAVKTYAITVNHITATITASYPVGATYCKCYKGSTEYVAVSNPHTFTVRSKGTWTIETELNGIVKTATATISADGDSQSVSIEYANITVTYDNNFKGKTITCTDGTTTYTATAPTTANSVVFTIPNYGTWTISATVSGTPYTDSVTVSSYTSYPATLALFNATITATFPSGATCTCNGVTASTSPYTFNIGQTGTYSVVCTLDGASKSESVVITTDGQSETCTFEYGTINLTFDNEFRGQTITCVNGGTTISKTAPISANTMVFYPPTTGNWTISGVYSGTTYVSSPNPVVVSSLSTPVSATLQTTVNATVTLHGAVGALISYTDAGGSKTQTLDENGEKANVTISVMPNSPIVVFEDTSVSKNPSDLSANYKKSVVIEPSLTDIYVCPENSLYWYGNLVNAEDITSANGWNVGISTTATTHNVSSVLITNSNTSQLCGIASATKITDINTHTVNAIINNTSGTNRFMDVFNEKTTTSTDTRYTLPSVNTPTKVTYNPTMQNGYPVIATQSGSVTVSALWYNTATQSNFFSAANDVVTYKSGGVDVVFAITDENGGAYVDYSALPSGTYTLTSSVAKNPSDLSAYYSKTVTISSATTEVYCMPDNVLYWWGYVSDNLESCTSANGWSQPAHTSVTLQAPAFNTNNVYIASTGTTITQGIGTKAQIDITDFVYLKAITQSSDSGTGNKIEVNGNKQIKEAYQHTGYACFLIREGVEDNGYKKISGDISNINQSVYITDNSGYGGASHYTYALWFE